ncbi:MAG: sigma-70 family RNA polymerase sigma factor [Tepidisphaeraceae bacterium]
MSDDDLLRLYVEHGSREAFEELARRHAGTAYAVALRRLGRRDLAEDVTQAVFLVLIRKAPRLVGSRSLSGWFAKVAREAAIDLIRRNEVRRRHERSAACEADARAGSVDPSADFAASTADALAAQLDDAVAELPEADRTVVVLRFYRGLSLADVGTTLGVSEDAARKRVERAVERLRRLVASRHGVATLGFGALAVSAASERAGADALKTLQAGPSHGSAASALAQAVARGVTESRGRLSRWTIALTVLALLVLTAVPWMTRTPGQTPSGVTLPRTAAVGAVGGNTLRPSRDDQNADAFRMVQVGVAVEPSGAEAGSPLAFDFTAAASGPQPLRAPLEVASLQLAISGPPGAREAQLHTNDGETLVVPLTRSGQGVILFVHSNSSPGSAVAAVPPVVMGEDLSRILRQGKLEGTLSFVGAPVPVRAGTVIASLTARSEAAGTKP